MLDKKIILASIKEPMNRYRKRVLKTIANWQPLADASDAILEGKEVDYNTLPPIYHPPVKMMQLIMEITSTSQWDWSDASIQEAYREIAESEIYKIFADTTVDLVSSLLKDIPVGTLVEIGTGPGQVTARLCETMVASNITTPIIISDRSPSISATGVDLRQRFPSLTIEDFVWDFRDNPPRELISKLTRPVLLFERFCIPYAGYEALHKIGPIADLLIMVEDLNLTGKKESYDLIFEKIGGQFFTFEKVREHLKKHFSFIHTCDHEAIKAIHSPVTDFTLALT